MSADDGARGAGKGHPSDAAGRRAWAKVLRGAALVWLVAHFALTALYLLPPTAVGPSLQPLLAATIGRHFEQNWSLFAPNPIATNYALLVRGLSADEVAALPRRGLPVDGWYDLSAPLWAAFARNRLSAYERLNSMQLRGLLAYVQSEAQTTPWAESCRRGDPTSCALQATELERLRSHAAFLLVGIASTFYADSGAAESLTHVALRLRETRPPPWSERYTVEPEVVDADLGVYPLAHDVIRPGLYVVGPAE